MSTELRNLLHVIQQACSCPVFLVLVGDFKLPLTRPGGWFVDPPAEELVK
ncbi:MAG TPA: hypothetical protein VE783_12585 [Candidatus Limnocylindrales bacterium]|nr:hypothetical protein [Candidatus Limnocylindrales bacterium]